jgi:hypothetical protein
VVFPLDNEDKYCILCQNIYWIILFKEARGGQGDEMRTCGGRDKEDEVGTCGGRDKEDEVGTCGGRDKEDEVGTCIRLGRRKEMMWKHAREERIKKDKVETCKRQGETRKMFWNINRVGWTKKRGW